MPGGEHAEGPPDAGPTAELVIHAWLEGEPAAFRARLTGTFDTEAQERIVAVSSDPEEVVAAVRSWLNGLLAAVEPAAAPAETPGPDPD